MIKLRSFENTDALIEKTLELLRETLPTPGNIMLSGGSTPYTVYNRLAKIPCPVHSDRKLFLSDERMVPADSTSNNAHNLEPMLKALQCKDRFIRIQTELPIKNAAERFADHLESFKSIDIGFLGMGADGHTAGFFTPEQALMNSGPLTLYTDRPDGMQGISVTPAVFQLVKRIILLVTGESKRNIIDTLLTQPGTIAAGIALAYLPNVELWTDIPI